MSRTARLAVATLVVLLVAAGLAWYLVVPKFIGDRRTEAHAPLFADIEPADDAIVRGTEAWIRWDSSVSVKGQVLWRRTGESRFQRADAGEGSRLLARLASLQPDAKYEYLVEQRAGDTTQRSSLRVFTVQAGLAFEPSTVERTVDRDYDQTVTLTLRNDTKEKITVAAKALTQFEDLPADIVGPGSIDEPAEVEPGRKLNLRLAIAAADASRDTYEIPIESAGAAALVRLRVTQPQLKLSFRVIVESPGTLTKTIEVRNDGDTIADLAIRVAQPNAAEVRLEPRANHARLGKRDALRFTATPTLYIEFQSLEAELEAEAGGQRVRFPLKFNAPTGQRLMGVRTGSHKESSCQDWYCTNRPTTCSTCPGPAGNGPAVAPPAKASRPVRRVDSLKDGLTGETRAPIGTTRALLFVDGVNNLRHLIAASGAGAPTTEGDGPCADAVVCADDDTVAGDPPEPRACDQAACRPEDVRSCYERARELQTRYRDVAERWFAEVGQRKHPAGDMDQIVAWHESQLEIRRRSGLPDWILDKAHVDNLKEIQSEVRDLRASYDALKEKCETTCGIVLPVLFGEMPSTSSIYDFEIQRLRTLPRAELQSELDKAGLPRNFLALCRRDQRRKQIASIQRAAYENRSSLAEVCGGVLSAGGALELMRRLPGALSLIDAVCWFYARSDKGLANFYKREACDPPRKDFDQVEQPSVNPIELRSDAIEAEHVGLDAVNANRWKLAYLQAWLTSYERYLGANAAHNRDAMVRQATAMVHFAARALAAGRRSAEKWHDFQHRALASLKDALKDWSAAGVGWGEIVEAYKKNHAGDMPSRLRHALSAGGMSRPEIEEISKRLSSMTKDEAEVGYELWRRRIESRAVQGKTIRTNRNRIWPDPVDLTVLVDRVHLSREFLEIARARPLETSSASREVSVRLRPGLREALQRRAAFSRAHRGAFAAPTVHDTANSDIAPAGWHTGDRVSFAWHQPDNEIVFAAFNSRGDLLDRPAIIGKGLWPRVAADGKRTAVAWTRGDGVMVRIHDGNNWGPELSLTGREAALAFRPGGPLHVATSTGLWRLGKERFDHVRQAHYSQPAIAVDSEGRPHVAWERDGRIGYAEAEIDQGQRPSLTITPDGTAHLAYLSKGALVVRTQRGGQWTTPEAIPARSPSWPTLATDDSGVRLTYIGAADHGPDALWLVRLPEKQPILMPSLAGNVTDAWVVVNFGLKSARSTYRPHDVLVTVNDVWVKMFENTVPDGRYLFRLDPYHLFTSSGRPAPNRIGIRSWHMNGGHYASNSDYQLIVQTAWSERYAFAATEDEVRRMADNPHPTHDQPDLVVLANDLELPVAAPKPGRINLTVTIANLGEAHSQAARIEMLAADGRSLSSAQAPPLKPGELIAIKMPLDYDGKLDRVTFKVHQEKRDLNPKNDTLTLTLWAAPRAGSDDLAATDGTGEQPPVPKFDSGIKLDVAAWVPTRDGRHGWWGVTRRGEGPTKLAHWTKTANALVVPQGNYDLYWKQAFDPAPVLLKTDINVPAGQAPTVNVDTGIHLDVAPWVPKRDRAHGWWGVTQEGDPPTKLVHWTKSDDALVVPPGTYDLYWKQAFDPAPVLLVSALKVAAGELRTVAANSGIKLRVAAGTPPLDRSHGWWGVVRAGEGADQRVHWSKGRLDQPLLVPPGRYDVLWKQNFAHTPERIKDDVTVEANRLVEIDVSPPRAAAPTGAPTGAGRRR